MNQEEIIFPGVTDKEWKIFKQVFSKDPKNRGKGMPHANFRFVLNTMSLELTHKEQEGVMFLWKPFSFKKLVTPMVTGVEKDGTFNRILLLLLKRARF